MIHVPSSFCCASQKEQTRTVRQLAFLKWPDMGSPDDSEMLLSFVKAVRQLIKPENSSPMIVHCRYVPTIFKEIYL